MRRLLTLAAGVTVALSATADGVDAMAIYYPHWHPYPQGEKIFGKGCSEWEFVKTKAPRYHNHPVPIRPLMGYYDETDPATVSKEIDLAADAGIDVFLYDWYSYDGVVMMEEALDRGFLKAPNRDRMKFALMWCYHDRRNRFRAKIDDPGEPIALRAGTPDEFRKCWRVVLEKYMASPLYYCRDGRPFFSIFNAADFMGKMGGPAKTKALLAEADAAAVAKGLKPLHWNAMHVWPNHLADLAAAGFSSCSRYNITCHDLPDYRTRFDAGDQVFGYDEVVKVHRQVWTNYQAVAKIPFVPTVTRGWDASGRCRNEEPFPWKKGIYPYGGIVSGIFDNKSETFRRLLADAKRQAEADPLKPGVVLINAWNEYTEGCWLVPDEFAGHDSLTAVRGVFGGKSDLAILRGRNALNECRYANYLGEVAEWLSLTYVYFDEETLPDDVRVRADVLVLPFNEKITAETAVKIDRFVKAGGKLLVTCRLPKAVGPILGVKQLGELWQERWTEPELTGMMPVGTALLPCTNYVAFTRLMPYGAPLVRLTGAGHVAATWARGPKTPRPEPNVLVTPTGTFASYLWFRGGNPHQRAYLEGLFRTVLSDGRVKARPVPEGVVHTPAPAGEHRGVWTSCAYGLPSMGGWDGTCKFLKERGATDVYMLVGAARANYASRILPSSPDFLTKGDAIRQAVSACRRHGLRANCYRSCWRMDYDSDPLQVAKLRVEGRLQLWSDLKTEENWRCPTDPRNRELEAAVFEELAQSGLDGIQMDFIRFDGEHLCFCKGCRARFERKIGVPIANWPKDVQRGGPHDAAWRQFRIDAISETVRMVSERARRANPKIRISAALIQRSLFDDERYAGSDHVNKIAQHAVRWLKEGWLDYACPMDYYTNTYDSMRLLASRQNAVAPGRVYPGIGMAAWTRPERDAETFANLIDAVRDAGCGGWMLYTLADDRAEFAWPHVHEPAAR